MVTVDVNVAPGPKSDGIAPSAPVKPFPDGVTVTPREERLAGTVPIFLTWKVTPTISPGANGPTSAETALDGRIVRRVNVTYGGPLDIDIEAITRFGFAA